ncbi:MAG: protease HtpX [Myxococcales bacterium]|nr:MAG: protease HtpX [Myxococcales bacterium]
MNVLKTGILMAIMTAIFLFAGAALGGQQGLIFALAFAVIANFLTYWFSDKLVLKLYGAREVSYKDAPQFVESVERLAKRAGLPIPRVYVIPSMQPNAFATGRNPAHAAVAATEGLLRALDRRELEGVIAHELAHVQHRDILIGAIVGTMAGAVSSLAWMAKWGAIFGGASSRDDNDGGIIGALVLAIVTPILALLVQLAISRSREYHADQRAGELTGDPTALASALHKIHRFAAEIPMAQAGPATAHLFIASPLSGGGLLSLLSTHPPVEDRIERLRAQAAGR